MGLVESRSKDLKGQSIHGTSPDRRSELRDAEQSVTAPKQQHLNAAGRIISLWTIQSAEVHNCVLHRLDALRTLTTEIWRAAHH